MSWGSILGAVGSVAASALSNKGSDSKSSSGRTATSSSNFSATPMERPTPYSRMLENFFQDYYGLPISAIKTKRIYEQKALKYERRLSDVQNIYDQRVRDGTVRLRDERRLQKAKDDAKKVRDRANVYDVPNTAKNLFDNINKEQRAAWDAKLGYQTDASKTLADVYRDAGIQGEESQTGMLNRILNREAFMPDQMMSTLSSLSAPQSIGVEGGDGFSFVPRGNRETISSLLEYEKSLADRAQNIIGERHGLTTQTGEDIFRAGQIPFDTGMEKAMQNPEGKGILNYLQDTRSLWEPMEYKRYSVIPSTESQQTVQMPGQEQSVLGQLLPLIGPILQGIGGISGTGGSSGGSGLNLSPTPQFNYQLPQIFGG